MALRATEAEAWNARAQTRLERAALIERVWHEITATMLELARLKPGERVLDVGTGHGEPALAAGVIVGPEGSVHGIDVAPEMIAVAEQRAALANARVTFEVQDAQQLDLPEANFDIALCRLALMFIPDVPAALGRILRALAPSGRLVVATIGAPEKSTQWNLTVETIVRTLALPHPGRPDRTQPGVFALAEPAHLEALLADAGFVNVRAERREQIWEFESPEEVAIWHTINPTLMRLLAGQPEDRCAAAWAAVVEAARAHADPDGRLRFPNELVFAVGEKSVST